MPVVTGTGQLGPRRRCQRSFRSHILLSIVTVKVSQASVLTGPAVLLMCCPLQPGLRNVGFSRDQVVAPNPHVPSDSNPGDITLPPQSMTTLLILSRQSYLRGVRNSHGLSLRRRCVPPGGDRHRDEPLARQVSLHVSH